MTNPSNTPNTNQIEMNQNDQILESLRPRMQAARVAHFRRLAAGVAVVPLLGFGAAAMAADGDSSTTEIEVASTPADDDIDVEIDLPELGDGQAEATPPATVEVEPADDIPVEATTTTTTVAPDPDAPQAIDLGVLGWVEVKPTDGSFEVLSYDLAEGWESLNSEVADGTLQLIVGNGDSMKLVTIKAGVRDEILVAVDEFVVPTTTIKPEPVVDDKPKEPAPAPIVDRFTVEVPGKGSFIVERDGETLYVGNVSPAEGYTYEIYSNQGWKVYVGFSNGETIFFGKALINDAGQVEQHTWDEQIGPVPTYQWVEISGIGAAKFEILDGQLRVFATETADGFESWDYNQGNFASTAKVDFEGEGQIWFIEAWLNENGELVSTSYQG